MPLILTITVVKSPSELGGEGGRNRVKGMSGTSKTTSSSSLLSKLCVSLSCPALDHHLEDIAQTQTTSAMPTTKIYPLPAKATMRDSRIDPDLDHDCEHDHDVDAGDPEGLHDKDMGVDKDKEKEKVMLLHERIASGRMSAGGCIPSPSSQPPSPLSTPLPPINPPPSPQPRSGSYYSIDLHPSTVSSHPSFPPPPCLVPSLSLPLPLPPALPQSRTRTIFPPSS